MFEKLKSAVASFASAASYRSLGESEVEKILWDFQLELLQSDVAQEVVSELSENVKSQLIGAKIKRSLDSNRYVKEVLENVIRDIFSKAREVDLLSFIQSKKGSSEPYVIVFLGINGTGKTTTIAKVAYLLKSRGFSVVIACSDTHRAGAIEQISEHARRISVKVVAQKYGADPAAVARDGVLYAKAHHIDVVLIDTAGRMQTSRNLMDEMAKVIRVVKPDFKLFIGDSLAGNDAVSQAKEFQSFTDFDGAILTKADADVKGGAALSIAYVTSKPILFLGVGQRYEDLLPFNVDQFVRSLFV